MREIKPTQKDVPSSDVKDLFFNSGLLDIWATSLERKYIDRFGNCHLTAAGMEWIFNELVTKFKIESEQALLAAGYAPMGTFQEGAEVTSRNGTVFWKLPDGDGDHYRWDGDLPKQVPVGSTPQSTGGIGKGAWISVGDATVRPLVNDLYAFGNVNVGRGVTVGSDISGANNLIIAGTRYPLNTEASGVVTEINVSVVPPYIKTNAGTYILKDVTKDSNTVEAYWAKGDYFLADGSINPAPTNNTPMLQIAWDHHHGELHYSRDGAYFVRLSDDGLTCIKPKSTNLTIVHGNRARTFIETNNKRSYKIYDFQDSKPVIVNDLIAEGDVATHVPTIANGDNGGEWGHGFDLSCAKDIIMNRCEGNRCWGDGFYFGATTTEVPENVHLIDCKGTENRRQGCSVVAGLGIKVVRPVFRRTGRIKGTQPMSGMDIEPNPTSLSDIDIQIIDPIFEDNAGGSFQVILHSAFNAPTRNDSGIVNCNILVSNLTATKDGQIDRGSIRIGGSVPNLQANKIIGNVRFSGDTYINQSFADALQISNFTDKFPKFTFDNLIVKDVFSGYAAGSTYGTTACIVACDFQPDTLADPLFKFGNIDIKNWSYTDTRGTTWSPTPTNENHRVKRPVWFRFTDPETKLTFNGFNVGNFDTNIVLDDWHFFFNDDRAPMAKIYGRKPVKESNGAITIASGSGMFGNGIDMVVTSPSSNSVTFPLPTPTHNDIGTTITFRTGRQVPPRVAVQIPAGVELVKRDGATKLTGPTTYERNFPRGEYNFYCTSSAQWYEI